MWTKVPLKQCTLINFCKCKVKIKVCLTLRINFYMHILGRYLSLISCNLGVHFRSKDSLFTFPFNFSYEQTMILKRQRDGSRLEFPCPTAVKDYNSYMGGVHKADKLCSIYDEKIKEKSKKNQRNGGIKFSLV